MSLKIEATSQTSAQISLNDVVRLLINSDGTLEASESPDEGDESKRLATTEWVKNNSSDLARFHTYLWTGKAEAMPRGDQQSSGQQLSDLMYPTMRQDVMATQFYCTESDWQADPYKRVTHWSLGDGVSWMRTPDKNGVQPGNVGAFYGAGSNPAGGKTGTAVIDAMRNIVGGITGVSQSAVTPATEEKSALWYSTGGQDTLSPGNYALHYRNINFNASFALPEGTTTDPITGEFRPRTWYGIWMIRMYGRVTNITALDAAGFNARLDLLEVRFAGLDAIAGQPSITGTAVLTGADNKLVMIGAVPAIQLEKGDVIRIEGAGEINAKLRTVESIVNNSELILNYEHCGARGNGSLKLQDYSGTLTITRIAKWHSAASGLGQAWVGLTSFRAHSTLNQNSTNREIEVECSHGFNPDQFRFVVGGVSLGDVGSTTGGVTGASVNHASIPPGEDYYLHRVGGAFYTWLEKR